MPSYHFSTLSVDAYLERVAEARRALASDPQRPRYHFTAPANWLNDPNGLIQWQGIYHMFYQHIPDDPAQGAKWWGHAVSSDLLRWQDRPLALAPSPGTADADGIWSGCCLAHGGRVYALYTGFKVMQTEKGYDSDQRPCLAWAQDDSLDTWEKYQGNPLVSQPAGVRSGDLRDHTAWREGDWWYQGIGSSIAGEHGAVQLYRSRDLRTWEYRGRLAEGQAAESGWMWECPSFFALGGRHVLITSPIPFGRAIYFSGNYEEERFIAQRQGELDTGGCFYAPQTFQADDGRRLMFGWLWEGLPERYAQEAGWAGAMSLPRVLTLDSAGYLCQQPAAEVDTLRGAGWKAEPILLRDTGEYMLPVRGAQLELNLVIRPTATGKTGVVLRRAADGEERTLVYYDADKRELGIDRTRSSRVPDAARDVRGIALPLEAEEELRLRIYLDNSVLEVFANERAALASRIYPQAESNGVSLYTEGSRSAVLSVSAWQMQAVW
ncbi:MAG: glycoside hydrolase family 32 protein [Chloroflexi bacterium]|nr:glycoside hydrolase family 32 protein [Chloroflexota bacterium]